MITQIGVVSGQILELLDRRDGVLIFGEVHSNLNQSRDLVLMGLGWLLHEGYIHIIEDPLTAAYQKDGNGKAHTNEAVFSDLIVADKKVSAFSKRIKNMPGRIDLVGGKILVLLEGCGGVLGLHTIGSNLYEHRDTILMSLGWLIRQGCVKDVVGIKEIFIFQPRKEKTISKIGSWPMCR